MVVAVLITIGVWHISKEDDGIIVYQPKEIMEPTLPMVSFDIQGYRMNYLNGYTLPMEITAAREVLTPLSPTGEISLFIDAFENNIEKLSYQVTSLDGETILFDEVMELDSELDETYIINLDHAATNSEETVLRITLSTDVMDVHYYTRIISYDQLMLQENADFVHKTHDAFFDQEEWVYLDKYFMGRTLGADDWNQITLLSSVESAQWNGLSPTVKGPVKWQITDATSVYTSTRAEYIVEINIEGNLEYYLVEEHYRTSYSTGNKEMVFHKYERQATQIMQLEKMNAADNKLSIGVGKQDVHYLESSQYNIIAFVQGKELFVYDIEKNDLTKIYGDTLSWNDEELDIRNRNFEYDIEILDVDNLGNVTYAVYGYVNSGAYEGNVGISLNYYDNLNQATTEKVFVKTEKAFAIGRDELRNSIHYNQAKNEIYLLANQIIYAINLETMEQEQISQVLDKDNYTVSENGYYLAFSSGEEEVYDELTVLDIKTGSQKVIKAREEEKVYPLGFLDNDIIIGHAKKTDTLKDYKGQEITPAYEIEIRTSENEVIKQYINEGIYIDSINVKDRVIYLNQVNKKNNIYMAVESDYIANNLEEERGDATIGITDSGNTGKLREIRYQGEVVNDFDRIYAMDAANNLAVEIFYPSLTNGQPYYVYANGDLLSTHDQISDAIIEADNNYGAVINSSQQYLWRRGARAIMYQNTWLQSIAKKRISEGQSVIEIVNAMGMDNIQVYTGTTIEDMCYLIHNDQAIGVRTKDGEWHLLVGYNDSLIYYLNEDGDKKSMRISQLDSEVDTIIGTSKF